MTPTIRRARPEDSDAILNLLDQVEAVHCDARPDLFRVHGTKYTRNELNAIIADDSRPIFVAELDGCVVGYTFCIIRITKDSTMLLDSRAIHLDDVCVDASCRGSGIGSALMEFVLAWAKGNGFDRVDLNVWEFNDGARRFYERFGFTTQKRCMEISLK